QLFVVSNAPLVFCQPVGQTVNFGAQVNLGVDVVGTASSYNYQWLLNGNIISDGAVYQGAATRKLKIANFATAQAGSYTVKVTTASGNNVMTATSFGVSVGGNTNTAVCGNLYPMAMNDALLPSLKVGVPFSLIGDNA